ncbi:MAG: adenosine deaminase [Rhizobiaceae bacterium]|nr:adenosine deaminase [Rhizobiaceae bacterium]
MAISPEVRKTIENLPKAELHVHLEGCLEPEMALAFARRNKIDFPHLTVEEIRKTYKFRDLPDFVRIMQMNSVTLVTELDFYELAYGYLKRAHEDNVVHAEMAMSPQGPMSRGVPYERVVESVIAAFEDARNDFGITGGVVLACLRQVDPEDGLRMLARLSPYRDKILALGLHGPEAGFPPAPFERHFAIARDMGWRTVAHAGEEGPPEYILQALDILKVDRIDHGVACSQNTNLMERLCEEQVPLTVCPISNVLLKVFPSLEEHNLPELLTTGLNVSLHSDDPAYFDGYLNQHLATLIEAGLLSPDELGQVCMNSFRSSFLDEQTKQAHIDACARVDGLTNPPARAQPGLRPPN